MAFVGSLWLQYFKLFYVTVIIRGNSYFEKYFLPLYFRIESTLVSLGWSKIEDKLDESFKLKWVECKSQINYDSFRDGQYYIIAKFKL